MQIQTIRYDPNDAKRMKKKQFKLKSHSFTPYDMDFLTFLMRIWILAKKNSQKRTHLDHSWIKYALDLMMENDEKEQVFKVCLFSIVLKNSS